MLKETETEETIGFVVIIFIIGGVSIGGRGAGSPGYVYGVLISDSLQEYAFLCKTHKMTGRTLVQRLRNISLLKNLVTWRESVKKQNYK